MIKRMIQSTLGAIGFEIRRKAQRGSRPSCPNVNDMSAALNRIKAIGILPDCIIDVGAAKGTWTRKAMDLWTHSYFVLIEPLREQIEGMPEQFKGDNRISVYEAVAGNENGSVRFNVFDDFDGSGVYGDDTKNSRDVKVVTLDAICNNRFNSILLKLDTHGYEIPIFQGGDEMLKQTLAIIVEVYGFHVSPTGKLFHEISTYLAEKGFRLFDVVDVMRRPADEAFWQADAVYLRKDNVIFKNNSYR